MSGMNPSFTYAEHLEEKKKELEEWWANLNDRWKRKLYNIFCEATTPDNIVEPEKYFNKSQLAVLNSMKKIKISQQNKKVTTKTNAIADEGMKRGVK